MPQRPADFRRSYRRHPKILLITSLQRNERKATHKTTTPIAVVRLGEVGHLRKVIHLSDKIRVHPYHHPSGRRLHRPLLHLDKHPHIHLSDRHRMQLPLVGKVCLPLVAPETTRTRQTNKTRWLLKWVMATLLVRVHRTSLRSEIRVPLHHLLSAAWAPLQHPVVLGHLRHSEVQLPQHLHLLAV